MAADNVRDNRQETIRQVRNEVEWLAIKKRMDRIEHSVDLLIDKVKKLLSRVDQLNP